MKKIHKGTASTLWPMFLLPLQGFGQSVSVTATAAGNRGLDLGRSSGAH